MLKYVPDYLKTEEMCKETARRDPYTMSYVPDHFKTEKICSEAFEIDPYSLRFVPIGLCHKNN